MPFVKKCEGGRAPLLSSLSEAVLSVSSLDLLCGLTTVRFYSGVKWLCIRLIAFSYDRKNPLADKSRGVGAREPIFCCYGYLLQSIKELLYRL